MSLASLSSVKVRREQHPGFWQSLPWLVSRTGGVPAEEASSMDPAYLPGATVLSAHSEQTKPEGERSKAGQAWGHL